MQNFVSLIYEFDPVNEYRLSTESNGHANWNSFPQVCDNGVWQTRRLFWLFPLYVKKEKVQNTEFLLVNETEVIINNCNAYL